MVRLDAIGDFFLWTHSGLRETFEYARTLGHPVVLLARHDWAEYAERLDIADSVLPIDASRFCRELLYRIRWLWFLRREGYEYTIQPRAARELWLEDWVVLAVGARHSIGTEGLTANLPEFYKSIANCWYSQLLPTMPLWHHEAERNIAFIRELSGAEVSPKRMQSRADVDGSALLSKPYFVVAPGAAHTGRQWPADRFTSVTREILESTTLNCVVIGTRNDTTSCTRVAAELPAARVVNLTAQTTIGQLVAVIGAAQFLLGNESGPCHIAAALGVRSVVVVGGGHFGWFVPYPGASIDSAPTVVHEEMPCFNCNWQCIFAVPNGASYPCIERIVAERVLAAVGRIAAPCVLSADQEKT